MELRKLSYPCKIHWLTRGPGQIEQSQKKKLIAEARRQVGIMHRDMEFQGLHQGRRTAKSGNYMFECRSVMGLDSVLIRMVSRIGVGEVVGRVCWCGCQMTLGVVTEVIDAGTGSCQPCDGTYPACALNDLGDYDGIRYLVRVCQKEKWVNFCCVATDFETYEVEDKVVVLFVGYWSDDWEGDPFTLASCGKFACKGVLRDKESDAVVDGIDGQFVILPYTIEE